MRRVNDYHTDDAGDDTCWADTGCYVQGRWMRPGKYMMAKVMTCTRGMNTIGMHDEPTFECQVGWREDQREMEKLRAAIPGMRMVTEGKFGGGRGCIYA